MVKKRNHFIPQLLLRRFSSRKARERQWLWQFRKGEAPVELVTRDAAVSTFFYGHPETGVEDSFAALEGKQAALLRELDGGANPSHFADEIRQLVWSLSFRTRALRGQFTSVAERAVTEMGAAGHATIADAFRREIGHNFDQYLNEVLARLPVHQQLEIRQKLRLPGVFDAVRGAVLQEVVKSIPAVKSTLEQAAALLNKGAATGQVNGLAKLFEQEAFAPDGFVVPHWSVVRFPANTVLLGDGVVFAVGPGGDTGTLGRFTKDFAAIYAPISHECALVGRRDDRTTILGLDQINTESVRLSLDTFFASRMTEVEIGLAKQIGTGEPILSDAELRRIAAESWGALGNAQAE